MKVNRCVELEVEEVSLCENPANPLARITLFKSADKTAADAARLAKATEDEMDEKELKKAQDELATAKAAFEKAQKDAADKAAVELAKAKAESEAAIAKAKAEADLAKADSLKALEAVEALKVSIALTAKRAEVGARVSKMKSLPEASDKVTELVVKVDSIDPALANEVLSILEKASVLAAKGLEQSSYSKGEVKSEQAQLDSLVAEKLKANPGMKEHTAKSLVYDEHIDLYQALRG